ncbi:MAG: tetratricopeptide repeat protein [Gammaproteobacteria bacterium]|jgi:TPR repeat protein|nr:tetratricopeptide repeat protein [Gammaproteobacteria bacterium]MDG2339536.1 tetratricopeptide repeat protein [Gammaproteobacteria bacterium]
MSNFASIPLLPVSPLKLRTVFLLILFLTNCASRIDPDPELIEAIRWYTGEAGTVDDVRARSLLESAAADGDALSMMWLARVYSTGRMTYPADKATAVEIASSVIIEIERLAFAGVGEASFLMGTAYAEGLAVPADPVAAVAWYRRAAAANITLAQHNLGNVHAAGTGVEQSDFEAVRWWLLAAQKGDAIPQFRLAQMYEQGKGVQQDLELAEQWYRESASRGYRNAVIALQRLQSH